jgi:type IV pilus assembly protein PilQ
METQPVKFLQHLALASLLSTASIGLAQEDASISQETEQVVMDQFGTVDLVVNETEVSQVLEMLAIQSQKNIIASNSVTGTVSANLYDVTFNEALEAILRVNGFAYIEEGNFVYVYTIEELETIEQARRKTESRIFELQYLSATDANEFITPLLSESGESAYRGDVEPGFAPTTSDAGGDSYAWSSKLVVNDFAENLENIALLLEQLDTPPSQVVVEATVVQTRVDEDNEFGIDFTALSNVRIQSLVNPIGAAQDLIAGTLGVAGGAPPLPSNTSAVSSGVGTTSSGNAPGLKAGIIQDHVGAFLKVIDQVADTTVLARPRITCLNRQSAQVMVGNKVGYLSTATATDGTQTTSVLFIDTGIQLNFRPFISPDGMIRLELRPSVAAVTFQAPTPGNPGVPNESTQELTTNIRCRDGETVILGGLFRESSTITRNQVPFLGDIPIIGAAFRGQVDAVIKEEIIFLLTPTIIPDEQLWEAGRDSLEIVQAVRIGARAGLLPFSHDQITANYNRDALDAYRQSDLDKAMYWSNLSLRSTPVQPEMIRLRELITNEKESLWERDLLRELMAREQQQVQASAEVFE